MSTTVDERVVQMRFDNQDFERRAGETMGTLDKLKSALSFKKSSDSLNDLQASANRFNMDGFAEAIDGIQNRFGALGTLGARIIENLADSIYYKGVSLVKSMTFIDQLGAGWTKYAQKTSAVQTIMAATRKEFEDADEQMEVVNSELDKLNWFTDETSYSFLDMVNNIGKFTSNNVELGTAVTAMQGISTWAALSGANIQEASRAMYNLSQALAAGRVQMIDWRSIENANMSTSEFKETAIETAVELGLLKRTSKGVARSLKGTDVTIESFTKTLQEGWFTSEALLKTLDKYGSFTNELHRVSEETGLTATQLLHAADKFKRGGADAEKTVRELALTTNTGIEEITKNLEILSSDTFDLGRRAFAAAQEAKTFQEAIDSVKEAVSTGWMNTFELLFGDYNTAKKVWTTVANELYDVFASGAEFRNEVLGLWVEQGGRDDVFAAIGNIWESLTSVLDIFRSVKNGTENEIATFLKEVSGKFVVFSEKLVLSEETLEKIDTIFHGLVSPIGIIIDFIKLAAKIVSPFFKIVASLAGHIFDLLYKIAQVSIDFKKGLDTLNVFGKIAESVVPLVDKLADKIVKLIDKFVEFVKSFGIFDSLKQFSKNIRDIFAPLQDAKTFGIVKAIDRIKEFKDSVSGMFVTDTGTGFYKPIVKFSDSLRAIKEDVKDFNTKLTDTGTGIDQLNSKTDSKSNFIVFIIKFRELIQKLKDLFSKFDLASILTKIGDAFSKVADILKNKINIVERIKSLIDGIFEIVGFVGTKIVNAITFVVDALRKATNGGFDFLHFIKEVESLFIGANLMHAIEYAIEWFLDLSYELEMVAARFKGGFQIKKWASAILTLALAMALLASIDPARLAAASVAMVALIKDLAIASSSMKGWFQSFPKGIIQLSLSILVLSAAVKVLSTIDSGKLLLSVGALYVLMASMNAFAEGLSKIQKRIPSILSLSVGILVLAAALKVMSTIDTVKLFASVGAMAALFLMLTFLSNTAGKGSIKKIKSLAIGILILAASLKVISSINPDRLGGSLTAIGILFALVGVLSNIAGKSKVKGIIYLSTGILVLAAAVAVISLIKPDSLGRAVAAIGALMLAIGIFSALMDTVGPGPAAITLLFASAILVLSAALLTFSLISWESIAKGMVAIAALAIIAETVSVVLSGSSAVFLAFAAGVALIGVGLLALGVGLTSINAALISFGGVLPSFSASIIATLDIVLIGLVDFVAHFLSSLGQFAGDLLSVVADLLVKIINVLIEITPKIIELGITLLLSLLSGLLSHLPEIVGAAILIVITFIEAVIDKIPDIIQCAIDLIVAFINGLAEALYNNADTIWDALYNLWNAILDFLLTALPDGAASGMRKFIDGLLSFIGDVLQVGIDLINGLLDGIKSVWDELVNIGSWIIDGVKQGIYNAWEALKGAGKWIGEKIVNGAKSFLGIHSPSKLFAEIGGYTVDGFALGIKEAGYKASDAMEDVAGDSKDSFENAIKQIDFDLDPSLNPVITPVLDLTDVKDGAKGIGDILGNKQAIKVSSDITSSENRRASFHDGQASTVGSNTTTNNGDFIFNIYSDSTMDVNDIASAVEQKIKTTFERKRFATL